MIGKSFKKANNRMADWNEIWDGIALAFPDHVKELGRRVMCEYYDPSLWLRHSIHSQTRRDWMT